jgi:hypothetical protein
MAAKARLISINQAMGFNFFEVLIAFNIAFFDNSSDCLLWGTSISCPIKYDCYQSERNRN